MVEDGGVDIKSQADMLRENVGTAAEWVAAGLDDSEGFSEVVLLTHPDNADLLCAAYNAFDKAGRELNVDATELAKNLDIAKVIRLLDRLSYEAENVDYHKPSDAVIRMLAEIMPGIPESSERYE